MKTNEVTISSKDIVQIRQDIELIKNHLLEETELTDWAKKELEEARKSPKESYVSMEELKKDFSNGVQSHFPPESKKISEKPRSID